MTDTTHLIITVHGIRTYGDWQDELKKLLEAAEPGVTVRMYRYGFFSSLAFLIPPLRWLVGRQFRKFFENEIRSAPEGARIDLVAHSFGTYLTASALRHLPERRKIHTVIFAGSVLPPSFPWYRYLQSGAVGRVVNECGWDDSVLVLCQSTALLMGMAGRIGFHGMVGDRFINRYYRWGHGGYFDAQQRFMREAWLPLLTHDGPVPAHDERPRLTAVGGVKLFLLNNMHVIKVLGACLLLMMLIFMPLDAYRTAANDKHAESFSHIALLTNAQEMPNRDPSHVTDLLRIDAKATGNEHAFEHMSSAQSVSTGLSVDAQDEERELQWWQWWEWLTGMSFSEREAQKARVAHHRANRQLVTGSEGLDSNRAKAQAYYEAAVRSYEKTKDDATVAGSYALCLIDYGQLLADRGVHEDAITQFKKAREEVFPQAANGKFPARPDSLAVDSLVLEAESLKFQKNPNWELAFKRLNEAVQIANDKDDNALRCDAYNSRGWFHMERLEADRAARDFAKAKDAATELVDDAHLVYRVRLFWIRHGLALADRLKGKSRDAYDQFDQIVGDLQELLSRDMTHTPKQRRDLRERLINSMERRADVLLFARQGPETSTADKERDEPGLDVEAPAPTSANDLWKAEDDFQKAIKVVGNDDLRIKARLHYKKVIARFLAEVENGPRVPALERDVRPEILKPIDIEFDEANRTLETLTAGLKKDLKVYQEIARACMDIRESARRPRGSLPSGMSVEVATYGQRAGKTRQHADFDPKAVDKLRSLTVEYAAECENLSREKVEMLLLALEILLKEEIEPDAGRQAPDATRMIAVLGATTKVTVHPELKPYFNRFKQIASRQHATSTDAVAGRRSSPPYREAMMKVRASSPEIVRFWLQIGPWLELKLTTERSDPPQARGPSIDGSPRKAEALSKTP